MVGRGHVVSLKSMLRSHDDSALEALTSKGLLRRAHRDLDAGLGTVESIDHQKACVAVEDLLVTLTEKGPQHSSCTCKAHGVCRHILLAVLLLRAQDSKNQSDAQTQTSVVSEVCALTEEELAKFAGADWSKAIDLAADPMDVGYSDHGMNATVQLIEMDASVTFIVGNELKAAAYKGLKTKKRLLITLAALLLRKRAGLTLPTAIVKPATIELSAKFVDSAQATIEQGVLATLASRSMLARDLFVDLAISTRCEAMPKLAAELRNLAGQVVQANQRNVAFDSESFLLDAARCYALLEVLRKRGPDHDLVGSVRQAYQEWESMEVWPVAAARWRTGTGARGLSAYGLVPDSGRWLTLLEGRGAGMDPSFSVTGAYDMPVWGAGTLSGVIGRPVSLAAPEITETGLISSKERSGGKLGKGRLALSDLAESAHAHKSWGALKSDLAARLGVGVSRTGTPVPALIAPTKFGALGFDDMNQVYNWELFDQDGASLIAEIPADDHDSALRLWKHGGKIQALVVEARLERLTLEIRPVSVVFRDRDSVDIHNLDFDRWPIESGVKKAWSKLSESFAKPLKLTAASFGPVENVISQTAEELTCAAAGTPTREIEGLTKRLDACGFGILAKAIARVNERGDMGSVLRAAYLLSEVQAIRALR